MTPSMTIAPPLALPTLGRRLLLTLACATLIGLVNCLPSAAPAALVIGRAWIVGAFALAAFCLMEQWPRRLPAWLARWVAQILGVVAAVPAGAVFAYWLTTGGDFQFMGERLRVLGMVILIASNLFFAPWIALGAIVRQREALVRTQQLAFSLERSELERQALDARMRLLQAQVQPHFLFNTLANVQALVDTGSPKASQVLGTLIAYLRAAVPCLDQPLTTIGKELALVQSYLELMHMRMPDRLAFEVHADDEVRALQCPPLTILTLVENAVRHGIDPAEQGGRIDIYVEQWEGRCRVRVRDTGAGLQASAAGLGTGLAALRERLALLFGPDTALRLSELAPHGVAVEVAFPARRSMP